MKAEDIKVGMWLRDPGGDVCQTSRQSEIVLGWHVEYPDGRLHTWPSEQLETWTPQVGEWVRYPRAAVHDGPMRVLRIWEGWADTVAESGGMLTAGVGVFEPCLPPAPPTTHLRADGVEVPVDRFEDANDAFAESIRRAAAMQRAEAQKAKSLAQPSAASADANTTCVHCGGLAYLGLQEARCLAPKCERVEPEPEVRELWVGFRHEKRPGERGIRDALLAPMGPEYERWWQATGRGVTKNHPIREEAIRLWREAVFRG